MSWITRDLGLLLILFLKKVDFGKTKTSTPLSNWIVSYIDSSQCYCLFIQPCNLHGLDTTFFFSQHLSASTSKFHRIWLHLKWWVKNRGAAFIFTSIRLAPLIFSSLCSTWHPANFWNGYYMVRTRFRLVISEFCYQHFREFHQESVENRRWYPHFHCWGTHPGS